MAMYPALTFFDWCCRMRGVAAFIRESDRGFDHDAKSLDVIVREIVKLIDLREGPTRGRVLRWANEILGIAEHLKRTDKALELESVFLRTLGVEMQGMSVTFRSTGEWPTAELKAGSPSDDGPPADPNADTSPNLGRAGEDERPPPPIIRRPPRRPV